MRKIAAPHAEGEGRTDFTLRELEVLRALVQSGKATVAAQRLGMSQPAVSRALSQLEATLGRQLFERSGGRLVPNAEALSINEQLGPVFAALARIADRSQAERRSHTGSLRIAAPPTIAHCFLPSRLAALTKDNPELEIVFDVISSDSLISSVAEAQYDVGLTDAQPAHEGIRTELLLATTGICVLPARHRLTDLDVVRPEDLEGEPFIALTRRHSARVAVDRIFERAGVRRKIVIETATSVSAAEFVREGLGVSLMNPFPIAHQLGRGIVVRPFEPSIPFRANFLTPADRPPSPATLAFIETTRASLETGRTTPLSGGNHQTDPSGD
ncbi:LysR substrate-binding domain-containing protein [Jiella mangrovi]|uniref:LysR family transcriptional regulator n=1 Tax=Jiella mangrovi TaxID=2821407 RepID=A0ABS4BLV5_9HYPH|nr:LysR substrate-binding domain-containing protein [Jiella mangrovi]MBP0617709.1 LysR family transcriptional regulator [Jiella mangrovi]